MSRILVYGYLTNLYYNWKIEQAVTQNIHSMRLSAMTYPDATFMRLKEDQMFNGQIINSAFNWQISMENQCILGYTIHLTTKYHNSLNPFGVI